MQHVPGIKSIKNTTSDSDLVSSGYAMVWGLTITGTAGTNIKLRDGGGAGTVLHETGAGTLAGGTVIRENLGGLIVPTGLYVDVAGTGAGSVYNVQYSNPGDPRGRDITQHDLGGDP